MNCVTRNSDPLRVAQDHEARLDRIERAFRAYLQGATDNFAGREAALNILNEKES